MHSLQYLHHTIYYAFATLSAGWRTDEVHVCSKCLARIFIVALKTTAPLQYFQSLISVNLEIGTICTSESDGIGRLKI